MSFYGNRIITKLECFKYLGCVVGEDLTNTAATYILLQSYIRCRHQFVNISETTKNTEEQDKIQRHIQNWGIKKGHIINHIQTFKENHERMLEIIINVKQFFNIE